MLVERNQIQPEMDIDFVRKWIAEIDHSFYVSSTFEEIEQNRVSSFG